VEIHHYNLRMEFVDEAQGFGEIAGFADDLDVRFAIEKASDGSANHIGIVGEQDFDGHKDLDDRQSQER
jgi:hypothetical protein